MHFLSRLWLFLFFLSVLLLLLLLLLLLSLLRDPQSSIFDADFPGKSKPLRTRKSRPKSKQNSITKQVVPFSPWLLARQALKSLVRFHTSNVWIHRSTRPRLGLKMSTTRSSSEPLRAECSNVSSNNILYTDTVHCKSTLLAFARNNQSEVLAENGRSWATMRWDGNTPLQERECSILNCGKPLQNGEGQGKAALKFLCGFAIS